MAVQGARRGRKCHLEDKTIRLLLRSSAAIVLNALRDKTYDKEMKIELARHFALKAIPNVVEGDLNNQQVVIVRYGTDKGVSPEEVSGSIRILRSPVSSNGIGLGHGKVDVLDSEGDASLPKIPE